MKLDCYREQHALDGVSVMTLSSVEVPVAEVLEHRLADVTLNHWNAVSPQEDEESEATSAPQRFRYRVGDSAQARIVEAEGMILGHGDASLISFLEHRYVPDADSNRTVDRLLGQLHRGEITRADWLNVMEEDILGQRQQRFRRRYFEPDNPTAPRLVGYHRNIRSLFNERQDALGTCLLRSLSDDEPHAIVTSFSESVDSEPVPRWRFAIMGEYGEGVGCWDGRRYRVVDELDNLPDALRHSLDRNGRVVARSKEWFAPLPDLRVEFLVRVPFASEVNDVVDPGPPPTWDELRRPSFLVDTRRPVSLRGRAELAVVEEPEYALGVITRCTTRGAFVPEMPPAPVEDIALSPDGQPARYLAGCWLR